MGANNDISDSLIEELIQIMKPGKLYQMTGMFSDMGQATKFFLSKESILLDKTERERDLGLGKTSEITVEGQPWAMYLGPSNFEFTNWVRVLYEDSIYLVSVLSFEHHLYKKKLLPKSYLRKYCV